VAKRISETAFASQVESLLNMFHWHWAHFRPARTAKGWRTPVSGKGKGFLDYVALRPPRIIIAELKDAYKPMTPEQQEWFDLWKECQRTVTLEPLQLNGQTWVAKGLGLTPMVIIPELYLWRPDDIERIAEVLR